MKRKKIIRVCIVIGIVLVVMLVLHLAGSSIMPMIKNHLGI